MSWLRVMPVLRSMLTSKDAEQRKLAHLMLKDAVIWLTLNTKAAPYTEWGTGGTETW